MAKVNMGIFPEMRGKLGDLVFSRNKYGTYIKEYRKPYNPNTPEQQEVKMRMKYLSEFWASLEYRQMAEWIANAKWLKIKNKAKTGFLSGYGFFMQTNLNLMNIGCKPMADSPTELREPIILTSVEADVISDIKNPDMVFKFEPTLDKDNVIVISATRPKTGFSIPKKGMFKKIGLIDYSWKQGKRGISIQSMYEKRFCERVWEKETVGFKFQVVEKVTGQAGNPFYVMVESRISS